MAVFILFPSILAATINSAEHLGGMTSLAMSFMTASSCQALSIDLSYDLP